MRTNRSSTSRTTGWTAGRTARSTAPPPGHPHVTQSWTGFPVRTRTSSISRRGWPFRDCTLRTLVHGLLMDPMNDFEQDDLVVVPP